MKIDRINSNSFGARIQIEKIQRFAALANEIQRVSPPSVQLSTGANYLSSSVSTVAGVSAGKTTAAGSGAVGTAFCADAVGINLSNITPSVIAKIASTAAPETIATSAEHPEVAGGLFTTAGTWFNKHFRFNFDNKTVRKFPS